MTPTCWMCGAVLDAGGNQPLVRMACRHCGQKNLLQRTFDHFVPVETLGVGGMATVYKARDTQLERFVALKLLHNDLSSEADHDAQLQQEARIAASVNHPNVVQIFSLGTDHGQFYVVMELIDHGSLDDLIESQGRLPEEQVLDVGIQIARGLRAAHRKGLIHRDVKPANILFIDEQAAKIGDFGLAAFATQDPQRVRAAESLGEGRLMSRLRDYRTNWKMFAVMFTTWARLYFMLWQANRRSIAAQIQL